MSVCVLQWTTVQRIPPPPHPITVLRLPRTEEKPLCCPLPPFDGRLARSSGDRGRRLCTKYTDNRRRTYIMCGAAQYDIGSQFSAVAVDDALTL